MTSDLTFTVIGRKPSSDRSPRMSGNIRKGTSMSTHKVIRVYEIELPDDRKEYGKLILAMLESDPEISTGNNGDPDPDWLEEQLLNWLTYQADAGNHTDIVDSYAAIEATEEEYEAAEDKSGFIHLNEKE